MYRKRLVEISGISFDDLRKLDKLYLNEPASFGSAKRLQIFCKISLKNCKMSVNKDRSRRFSFPRLKVVVYNKNEI